MQKCSICNEGNLAAGKTTVMLERNGSIVLLKYVPALICDNCASYFLDSEITRKDLNIAECSLQNGTELKVVMMSAHEY